jgi:hypothetical protein
MIRRDLAVPLTVCAAGLAAEVSCGGKVVVDPDASETSVGHASSGPTTSATGTGGAAGAERDAGGGATAATSTSATGGPSVEQHCREWCAFWSGLEACSPHPSCVAICLQKADDYADLGCLAEHIALENCAMQQGGKRGCSYYVPDCQAEYDACGACLGTACR